ncbi:MAG TPA: glycosyltransferase family 4 protein [Sphingomicrobium sp.]|nr:glycosyltransferase family 4 protein [Sphingomicrobium sp.]
MSALRLLLVTDAVGGVWVYSIELARALLALGVETVLAVAGPPPDRKQRDEANGFKLIETSLPLEWLANDSSALARAGVELARLADEQGVDVVQTSSAALLASTEIAQPCVALQHSCVASWWEAVKGTTLPADFEWRRTLVQRGLQRASAIVAPSIAFAADTTRIYGTPAIAVHNGRTPLSSRAIPQGGFVFTAGRLWDEGKNVATLDAAAGMVDTPFQAAGPLEGPNGTKASVRHMEPLGMLSEARLAGLYAARPIYASAALYEPFGLSVLEAAQAGCALVLSDIATHREMWGGAAVFVPATNPEAFASAIGDIMADADEREQLGRLAAARATHYTPTRMARGMAEIYARVIGSSAPVELAGAA